MAKLSFRLIPTPLHGLNLRIRWGKSRWRRVRGEILKERAIAKCETCGASVNSLSELEGHESWHYDTSVFPAIARLRGITFSCKLCHSAEHFGVTLMLFQEGTFSREYVERVIEHYCAVNQCNRSAFEHQWAEATAENERLSKLAWGSVDFGPFASLFPHIELPLPLPGEGPFDDERHKSFLDDLDALCARYGYWIGRTSSRDWLPIHLCAPGVQTGGYEMREDKVIPLEIGAETMTSLFISWTNDPKRLAPKTRYK